MVEIVVSGLGIDGVNQSPVVLLKEKDGDRVLPIWIGPSEASAIAMELAGVKFKRPLSHDLIKIFLNALDVGLEKVVISSLKNNTYFAHIHLSVDSKSVSVDARPSDSIAVALRMKAPIFTSMEILDKAPPSEEDMPPQDQYDAESLREYLKNMNPEDFGKFNL